MRTRLLSAIICLSTILSSFGQIVYVHQNATGNNDGSSWEDAYLTINSAVSNASANDEIWIASGVYIPRYSSNNPAKINVQVSGLRIYGGFNGTESQLSERDLTTNETVITGDVNGNDGSGVPDFTFSSGSTGDNLNILLHYQSFSETNQAILDGITFRRAYLGGAVLLGSMNFPNISIANCKFENNLGDIGAAIVCNSSVLDGSSNTQTLKVDRCIFKENVSRGGSCLYFLNNSGGIGTLDLEFEITNSLFFRNIVKDNPFTIQGSYASALYIYAYDSNNTISTKVINNTFVENEELGTLFQEIDRGVLSLEASSFGNHDVRLANNIFFENITQNGTVNSIIQGQSNIDILNSIADDNFANIPTSQLSGISSADPLFVDDTNNNFSLQASSPAIDFGVNGELPTGLTQDLNGNDRITNGTVDAGAYEFTAPVCTITIPDTEFKAALLADTNININGDSEIQCDEATDFTGLLAVNNTNYFGISDITGLEAFVNITGLNLSNQNIENIDLTANSALALVNLNENNNLISIDVSALSNLENLQLQNSDLTSIDLSNNTALDTLVLGSPNLVNPDLSNNNFISYLQIENSGITSIDVTAMNGLTQLRLQNNNLSELNLSQNTNISFLLLNDNDFTSLNIANGNNDNINTAAFNNNPLLTCIQIDANFTPPISSWFKDANAIYSDDCAAATCVVTIPDANFKSALLGDVNINTNNDGEIQCDEAANYTGTLDLTNQNISDLTGAEAFVLAESIDVTGNPITIADFSFTNSFTTIAANANGQLNTLDVSGAVNLEVLELSNTAVTTVDVSNNVNLLSFTSQSNSFSSLDLSNNVLLTSLRLIIENITELDVSANTALTSLVILQNQLTSLNIANGNNANITNFDARFHQNLDCIQIDSGFTPPTDGTWQKDNTAFYSDDCASLSTGSLDVVDFDVYPNPVENELTILTQAEIKTVQVYNLVGQEMLETTNNSINVSHLTSGIYLLHIETETGLSEFKRIIKE